MDWALIQYVEINGIGLAILLMMFGFLVSRTTGLTNSGQKMFKLLLLYNAMALLSDIVIHILSRNEGVGITVAINAMCMVYMISHSFFGYAWIRYCIVMLYPQKELSPVVKNILTLPAFLSMIMVIANNWTGWVYTVTSDNYYARGPYINLFLASLYLYVLICVVLVVNEMRKPERVGEDFFYKTLLIFPLPIVAGNIIQMIFYGISLGWVCCSLSLLLIFINIQNNQISRDNLTGLYNHMEADEFLKKQLKKLERANLTIYVMMIDIDSFKLINDKYGHIEGDRAITYVSRILLNVFSDRDLVGRFGGDEFIVSGEINNEDEISYLVKQLDKRMKEFNESQEVPYELSVSVGYSVFRSGEKLTIESMIAVADDKMYENKSEKKKAAVEVNN